MSHLLISNTAYIQQRDCNYGMVWYGMVSYRIVSHRFECLISCQRRAHVRGAAGAAKQREVAGHVGSQAHSLVVRGLRAAARP